MLIIKIYIDKYLNHSIIVKDLIINDLTVKELKMNKFTESAKAMISVNQLHKKAFDREVSKTGLHRTQHFILMKLAREGTLP